MGTKHEVLFMIVSCLFVVLIVVLTDSNTVKKPIYVNEAKVLNIEGDTLIISKVDGGKSIQLEIRKTNKSKKIN